MVIKQKEYLTTREAAEKLGVAVSTIQLWANNGLLRAWTTGGGHRRIVRKSVEDMLEQQQSVLEEQSTERQISIVVLEDNAQLLRLHQKQILSWNSKAHVVTAKDGYDGLIKIGNTLPDVIITDLMMPNMDGFQVIRAIKEHPELNNSLVIVVTGLTEEEIESKGSLPQGVHLFFKPVPFDEIVPLLRQKAITIV